jgi:hypothetical protein
MSRRREEIRDAIFSHGKGIDSGQDSSDDLASRLDKVELLIEDIGVAKNVLVSLDDYLSDAKGELQSIKKIRFWAVLICFLTIILLLGAFVCGIYFAETWIISSEQYVKGAFLIATVGGAITLLIALLRGAFRSIADRHKSNGPV